MSLRSEQKTERPHEEQIQGPTVHKSYGLEFCVESFGRKSDRQIGREREIEIKIVFRNSKMSNDTADWRNLVIHSYAFEWIVCVMVK